MRAVSDDDGLAGLRRAHSALGLLPLSGYLFFHAWQTAPATAGRAAFAERLAGGGGLERGIEVAVVLALAAHAILGARLYLAARQGREAGGYASASSRTLQLVTGVITLAFVIFHAWHAWLPTLQGTSPAELYDALYAQLGRPVYFVPYVLGVTATTFHLAQGLSSFARTWGLARDEGTRRFVRLACGAVGILVWLVLLNTLSHFVVGRAFLSGDGGGAIEAPASPER